MGKRLNPPRPARFPLKKMEHLIIQSTAAPIENKSLFIVNIARAILVKMYPIYIQICCKTKNLQFIYI